MSSTRGAFSSLALSLLLWVCAVGACTIGDIRCFCGAAPTSTLAAGQALLGDPTSPGCNSYFDCQNMAYSGCPVGSSFSQTNQRCQRVGDCPPPTLSASAYQAIDSRLNVTTRVGPLGSQYVGYYESWRDPWTSSAASSRIANLPPYVTQVLLSFFNPSSTYTGGVTFAGTGLDFSSDPQVVKESIAILKSKNPNTKVLLSVGGATYSDWTNLNPAAVATFVSTFGLDGVDVDFEPQGALCRSVNGQITCATDALYIASVQGLRNALPADKMLTAAVWSIGAYVLIRFDGMCRPACTQCSPKIYHLTFRRTKSSSPGTVRRRIKMPSPRVATPASPSTCSNRWARCWTRSILWRMTRVQPTSQSWPTYVFLIYVTSPITLRIKYSTGRPPRHSSHSVSLPTHAHPIAGGIQQVLPRTHAARYADSAGSMGWTCAQHGGGRRSELVRQGLWGQWHDALGPDQGRIPDRAGSVKGSVSDLFASKLRCTPVP